MWRNTSSHPASKLGSSATQLLVASSRRLSRLKNYDCCGCSFHCCWCWCRYCKVCLSQLGQSWRVLCWMLPQKSVVSPRTISGNLKSGGGMNRWTKLCKRSVHGSKPEERRHDGKSKNCLHWHQARGKAYHLAGKVWGREGGICHSIPRWWWCFPYNQTDGPHKPGRCWWLLCTQWCWWACAHWQRQDEGMGWALCWAAQYRIWVAKKQDPWGPPSNCWPLPSVSVTLIHKSLSKVKCVKAAGPSGIIAEMLKAAGEEDNWLRLFSAVVWSHQNGRRASFWTSIRARWKPWTEATVVVWSLQINSWSCWNGYYISYICKMVNINEMQFGFVLGRGTLFASCRESTLLLPNCSLSSLRKPLIVCQGSPYGGP